MDMIRCMTCGHTYTMKGKDIPHTDSSAFERIHGFGTQCRACYLKAGHWECVCGELATDRMKYCSQCGIMRPK